MQKSDVVIVLQRADDDCTSGNRWWVLKGEELEKWLKDGSISEPDIIVIPKRTYIAKEITRIKIKKIDIKELVKG